MKIEPIDYLCKPNYPDKYSNESRQALSSSFPKRWLKTPLVLSLSAIIALGANGCNSVPTITLECGCEPSLTAGIITNDLIVPLFIHGEGTGGIGCISIAAPVFMSEEDAYAILASAFEDAGLTLFKNTGILEDATVPLIYDSYPERWETQHADLYVHEAIGISVTFVSQRDVSRWERSIQDIDADGSIIINVSSAKSWDMKRAAEVLAKNNTSLVVFYDPVSYVVYGDSGIQSKEIFSSVQDARKASEALLRQQVIDFSEWLQSEGLIQCTIHFT